MLKEVGIFQYLVGKQGTNMKSLGQIKINNLSFRYSLNSEPILNNLTSEITEGAINVVLGPSGGGKRLYYVC